MVRQYDEKFYKTQVSDSYSSAREIAPFMTSLVSCRSVIDVGCGLGTWVRAFKESGVQLAVGIDGEWVAASHFQGEYDHFYKRDLSRLDVEGLGRFDLVISMEVGEHLPHSSADHFVECLTRLAPLVLFSAAIPGQGGRNHINEQWPDYWENLFIARGYKRFDVIRGRFWGNSNVAYYYAQNAHLFVAESETDEDVLARLRDAVVDFPVRAIHPAKYLKHVALDVGPKTLVSALPRSLAKALHRKLGRRP